MKIKRFLSYLKFKDLMKHFQNIDCILMNLKCTELTLMTLKLMFCFLRMKLIGLIYDENERHLNSKKIVKIV